MKLAAQKICQIESFDYNIEHSHAPERKMAGQTQAESQEVNKENETQESTENEKVERVNRLPLTRIKHIIKMDPDVTLASQDAVVMIAKAAVSFA